MNEEALDYIRASSGAVPRTWAVDDVFLQLARGTQQMLVAGNERWVERTHVDVRSRIRDRGLDPAILSQSRRGIEFHDGSALDFVAVSSTAARFMGHWWDVAFLQQFMVNPTSQEGMPCYRIPPQADWHLLNDAIDDAVEFLSTHQGEAEFDFQGNRYKVPYGCDYCVMVGPIFPSGDVDRVDFYLTGGSGSARNYYGSIFPRHPSSSESVMAAQSLATQIPQHVIDQAVALSAAADNTTAAASLNAPIMRQHAEQAMQRINEITNQRLADYVFRPSPTFERLRHLGAERVDGGAAIRHPIQFALPDPMTMPDVNADGSPYWHGQPRYVHLSEIATYPGATMDPGPSVREVDLRRRLDTVRECISSMPNPLVFRDPEMANRFLEALNYPTTPAPDASSYVYRYEFVNGQALKVDEKLSHGTILDAAARPVRKFRLVEE